MTVHVEAAREEIQRASDGAPETIRKQLNSVDEGLMEVTEGDKTQDGPTHEDRIAKLADKLSGLLDETDGETKEHIRNARDHLASDRAER